MHNRYYAVIDAEVNHISEVFPGEMFKHFRIQGAWCASPAADPDTKRLAVGFKLLCEFFHIVFMDDCEHFIDKLRLFQKIIHQESFHGSAAAEHLEGG
ncbi:MAG: hypothetical protein II627_02380, partial [Lachnospiraceae bacterium]|nr:hypothetical protein [Lachnospiraceae bacterium]